MRSRDWGNYVEYVFIFKLYIIENDKLMDEMHVKDHFFHSKFY